MAPCSHPQESSTLLFSARETATGDVFSVAECRACGFAVTTPAPPALESYYREAYYGAAEVQRAPRWARTPQRLIYAARARAVARLAGGRGRVLDVGCGPGWLLEAFRASGWEAHGTELSERSAAHARERLGLDVRVGTEAWATYPEASFDAVTCWHVLEHLASPADVIRGLHRVLRDRGVLMLGVPNFASLEARLAREAWFHLDVPRHLTHFTPRSLARALGEGGFEVRRTSFVAPEFDTFSFVQTAQNALGLRRNLLYELLRGSGCAGREGAASQVLASVALAAPLGLVAAVATPLVSLARCGSSLVMWATKRPS